MSTRCCLAFANALCELSTSTNPLHLPEPIAGTPLGEPMARGADVVGDMARLPVFVGAAIREGHHHVVLAAAFGEAEQAPRTDAHALAEAGDTRLRGR